MRIIFTFLITAIIMSQVCAQDFTITFSGEGAALTVDSVQIDNLMQGTSTTVKGDEALRLMKTPTAINQVENLKQATKIYPTPGTGTGFVNLNTGKSGNSLLEILDLSGKQVAKLQTYLEIGRHSFAFKGLDCGVYLLMINTQEFVYLDKIVSQEAHNRCDVQLVYIGLLADPFDAGLKALKNASSNSVMQYNTGDRLKFIGYSGNYREVRVDIPTENRNIEFTFMDCTDGDQNHYPVVTIGTQTWMAENLRTSHYNHKYEIPLVTENSDWGEMSHAGYCWYNNDEVSFRNTYGGLYNWYAINSNKLCPAGWHVSTDEDWTVLENYLISEGYNFDGTTTDNKIAKALSSNKGWELTTNKGAVGNSDYPNNMNSIGFTALPGGSRSSEIGFADLGVSGLWWAPAANNTGDAWYRLIRYEYSDVVRGYGNDLKREGFSVRCVKNNEIPEENLIAWYPLNGNATDSSGNNNGIVYGVSPTYDKFNNRLQAMLFAGDNDYIDLPDNNQLGSELTISAWVKLNFVKTWARIIEYGNGENNNNIGLALSMGDTRQPCFLLCDAVGCDIIKIPSELQFYSWTHVAFTLKGTVVKGYINGELVVQSNTTKPHEAVNRTINYIGRSNFVSDKYAAAAFDNIRVYNRALTDIEIIALTGE